MKIDNRLVDAKSESENTENFNRIMSLLDKNRTHYTEQHIIFPETTLAFNFDSQSDGYTCGVETPENLLVDGEQYTVYWDNQPYVLTALSPMTGLVVLGEFDSDYNVDYTNIPFAITQTNLNRWAIVTISDKSEHTIKICNESVIKIPEKYIPEKPEFIIDATDLPTDNVGWGELYTALKEAYKANNNILLDLYGNGSEKLKLSNYYDANYLFLYPGSSVIYAYILTAMPSDGGSLKKYTLTAAETT